MNAPENLNGMYSLCTKCIHLLETKMHQMFFNLHIFTSRQN